MNAKVRERAKEMKEYLGTQLDTVKKYIQQQVAKGRKRNSIVYGLQDKFDLNLLDSASVWYAWQTYML